MSNPDNYRVKQRRKSGKNKNKRYLSSTSSEEINHKRINSENIFEYFDTFKTLSPRSSVKMIERPSTSGDPSDMNISLQTFMQNTNTKIDMLSQRIDALNSKHVYIEHKLTLLESDNELSKGVHTSLRETLDNCTKELSDLKVVLPPERSNMLFPYQCSIVVHNIQHRNEEDSTRYVSWLLEEQLLLKNIEIMRTKVVQSKKKRGMSFVFVELKNVEQKINVLRNKHLLRNMRLRTTSSKPIYIHPMKSSEAVQNENNMKKLINLIPEANRHVEVTNRGTILYKKPLLPTPNTHHNRTNYQRHQTYQHKSGPPRNNPDNYHINNSQKNQTTRRPVNNLQQQQHKAKPQTSKQSSNPHLIVPSHIHDSTQQHTVLSQPTVQSHPGQKPSYSEVLLKNQNATIHGTQNVLPSNNCIYGVQDSRYTQNTQHQIQQRSHISTHSSTNNSSTVTTITQTRPQHDSQLTTLTSPREAQPILYNVPLSATADIVASASSVLNENCDQQLSFGTEENRCNYGVK